MNDDEARGGSATPPPPATRDGADEETGEYPTLPPSWRPPQATRFGLPHAWVVPVRWASVAILSLMFVLCVWIVLSYLRWINDPHPDGVLPRAVASELAVEVSAAPVARPRRVVVLLIDGLRADVARRMPVVNGLAEVGVDMSMDVGLPTYSRPVYAALSSGTRQDRNGIRSNSFSGPATVDSLWARATDAGLRAVGVSNLGWWSELFPGAFEELVVTSFLGLPDAAEALLAGDAELVLIHPTEVDFYGHEAGARDPRYGDAALAIDRLLGAWLAPPSDGGPPLIDLERDALFVLSDHGHRRRGGHGGDEPEVRYVRAVAAGRGITEGVRTGLRVDQIAPTISVLLGIPFPHDVEGAPATAVLDPAELGDDYLDARALDWAAQTSAYLFALAEAGRASFDPVDGFAGWRRGMMAARAEGRWVRLSLAAVGLGAGFVLILGLRRDPKARILPPALAYLAFFLLAALLTDNATSLSAAEREHRYAVRLFAFSFFAFVGQMGAVRAFRVEDWDTVFMLGAWISVSSVVLVLAHYGIPLTAPLPPAALTFWPFFGTFLAAGQSGLGLLMLVLVGLAEHRGRRRRLAR